MTRLTKTFGLLLAAPALLALAGCGGSSGEGDAAGEPVAAVPAPNGGSWSEIAVRTPEGGWLVGNPDAPIKLVEYGSVTCPACALFSTEGSAKLHSDYVDTGRVSYEFRTVLIHGIIDLLISRVLECAPVTSAVPLAEQSWGNLNDVTGPFQANGPQLEEALKLPENQRYVQMAQIGGLTNFFAARGISADQTNVCLADAAAVEALANASQEQATKDGINHTPTFFLNGRELEASRWGELEPELQRAGAR